MTKINYDHATPQLVKRVREVIGEAAKHKYSVSRVYAAYNEAFGKRDQPQTCSSCLRNRVRELKEWYNGLPADKREAGTTVPPIDESSVYDKLVKRLALNIDGGPESELATLRTVLEPGYPNELSEDEQDAVLERVDELEGIVFAKPQYLDPAAPGFVPPAAGVVRHPMGEDTLPIDFTPNEGDANKGTVLNADGTTIKPGTYTTPRGIVIAVQPGGKATIKEESLI